MDGLRSEVSSFNGGLNNVRPLNLFYFLVLIFSVTFFASESYADYQQKLVRKIAVFPIFAQTSDLSNAEDAWWQVREILAKDQRFLVASRRLMVNRGVFQPRKQLKPSDAIILGKILDADLVATLFVEERDLHLRVYEAENGYRAWEGNLQFHPAIPIQEQIVSVSQKITQDFVSAVPFHGFTVLDELKSKVVYELGQRKFAQVFVGNSLNLEVGEQVQWVQVYSDFSKPLFEAPRVVVVAEGEILKLLGDRVEVEIKKLRNLNDLHENSLIQIPKEVSRLKEFYRRGGERPSILESEYFSSEMKSAEKIDQKHSSTSTALAFIANLAAIILLAF